MTSITIKSADVLATAKQLEVDNTKLYDLLKNSEEIIDNLDSYHKGPAAEALRETYSAFADRFFEAYHAKLKQYVEFLRYNVVDYYEEVEDINKKLARDFP